MPAFNLKKKPSVHACAAFAQMLHYLPYTNDEEFVNNVFHLFICATGGLMSVFKEEDVRSLLEQAMEAAAPAVERGLAMAPEGATKH